MQAVKVGWVGQTFALARCSDTQGKKTRNRKTKEERKAMVETFLKKYRKSNNGNFPSLNLTHKEVGGSFYTVREIVREIIQDNRILGPGDSASKVLTLEDCDDQPSLGTLSFDKVSNFPLMINGKAADGSQIEGLYSYSECNSILEGVITTSDDVSVSRNSTSHMKEIQSSDNTLHKSQDVGEEAFLCNESLQSEKEPYGKMRKKDHIDSSKDSGNSKEHQVVVSQNASTSSSSDAIFPTLSEIDFSVESSHVLLSSLIGGTESYFTELSDSVLLNQASDEVIEMDSGAHMNIVRSREVEADESHITAADASEITGVLAMGGFDASVKSEAHSSSLHLRDATMDIDNGLGHDFKEKGKFVGLSEEVELGAVIEKDTEMTSVDSILIEVGQSQSVTSNIIVDEVMSSLKAPASSISEHSTSEILEIKVESISSGNVHIREGSTMNRYPKELLASSTKEDTETESKIKFSMGCTGATKDIDEADRQSIEDASKQQQVFQPDPFWDAIKKFVAAFVKFWTE